MYSEFVETFSVFCVSMCDARVAFCFVYQVYCFINVFFHGLNYPSTVNCLVLVEIPNASSLSI